MPIRELLDQLQEEYLEDKTIKEFEMNIENMKLGEKLHKEMVHNNEQMRDQQSHNWGNRQQRNAGHFGRYSYSHVGRWKNSQYQNNHRWYNPPDMQQRCIYRNSQNNWSNEGQNGNNNRWDNRHRSVDQFNGFSVRTAADFKTSQRKVNYTAGQSPQK